MSNKRVISNRSYKAKRLQLEEELELVLKLTRQMGQVDIKGELCVQYDKGDGEFLTVTKTDLKNRQRHLFELIKELNVVYKESHERETTTKSPLFTKQLYRLKPEFVEFLKNVGYGEYHLTKDGITTEGVVVKLLNRYVKEQGLDKLSHIKKKDGSTNGGFFALNEPMLSGLPKILKELHDHKGDEYDPTCLRKIELTGLAKLCCNERFFHYIHDPLSSYTLNLKTTHNPEEAYQVVEPLDVKWEERMRADLRVLQYEKLLTENKLPNEAYQLAKGEHDDPELNYRSHSDEDLTRLES